MPRLPERKRNETRMPSVRRGRPPANEGGAVRKRLLDRALALFASRGFDGTSVREIAAAAEVSSTALYAHFATKRDLYNALFREAGPSGILGPARKRTGDVEHPARFIRGFVDDLMRMWSAPRFRLFTSMLARELAASDHPTSDLQPAIVLVQSELAQYFRGWRSSGALSSRSSDSQLAWELIAPLIYIRLIYLQAHAAKFERTRAFELARNHADHFIRCIGSNDCIADETGTLDQ